MHDALVAILVLLGAALALGALAERLRQTAVLGYLLAGTVVGPGVLGWVSSEGSISALAELGAATLLFSIGTEFSMGRLRALGTRTFATGAVQVAVTCAGGMTAGLALGLEWRAAAALGAITSLSSTAVVMRLLVEQRAIDSAHGRLSMGVLLTQDLAVVPLVVMVALLAGGGSAADAASTLARTAGWAVVLVAGYVVLVRWVFPWFLGGRGVARNRDLVAVFAVTCAVGSALGAEAAGLSPALGAFVAGVLLGGSPFAAQVRAEVTPLRTILLTLFFASVGLAGDPAWAWEHRWATLAAVSAIVAGKSLLAFAAARMCRTSPRSAAAAALCLAQIGEFSFVIAEVARDGGLLDGDAHRLVVTSTIGSLALAPFMVTWAQRLSRSVPREPGTGAPGTPQAPGDHAPGQRPDVVIVGFGPAGQRALAQLPPRRRASVAVVDSNPALVAQARQAGAHAHLGDARRTDVLEHAGVRSARVVAVTTADVDVAGHVASLVRHLAPTAMVIARSRYRDTAEDIARQGAHRVVDEESLVGIRLASAIEAALRGPRTG